jgi:hypothetical protein
MLLYLVLRGALLSPVVSETEQGFFGVACWVSKARAEYGRYALAPQKR